MHLDGSQQGGVLEQMLAVQIDLELEPLPESVPFRAD